MPMYFPDLKSVQSLAKDMSEHKLPKKYQGIIPETDDDLPEARKQLAQYLREIWHDEVFALEVELAVSEDDYEEKMKNAIKQQFASLLFVIDEEEGRSDELLA
jgi:hypothetical protein